MGGVKVCDSCGTTAQIDASECLQCSKTTFSYPKNDESTPLSRIDYQATSRANQRVEYEVSVIEGLLDTTFTKYVTRPVARLAYILAQISILLLEIFALVYLWRLFDVANAESAVAFLFFLFTFALVTAILLYILASTRLALEAATALVQIAKNTSKSD